MAPVRRRLLEGRRSIACGDEGVVESAFGGDGLGGVVGAGVAAFGHHHAAVTAGFDNRRLAGPERGGGFTQFREQMQAARIGGVGVAGR